MRGQVCDRLFAIADERHPHEAFVRIMANRFGRSSRIIAVLLIVFIMPLALMWIESSGIDLTDSPAKYSSAWRSNFSGEGAAVGGSRTAVCTRQEQDRQVPNSTTAQRRR